MKKTSRASTTHGQIYCCSLRLTRTFGAQFQFVTSSFVHIDFAYSLDITRCLHCIKLVLKLLAVRLAQMHQLVLFFLFKGAVSTNRSGPASDTVTPIQVRWLLDAVRHVKSQKQRPDRDRICRYIQQHHDVTSETVSLLLDAAVKNGILTTTITRGNTENLTYVITATPDQLANSATKTVQSVTKTVNSAAASKLSKDKTSSTNSTDTAAAETTVNMDNDDKKLLHNKSDISPFMVKAVKGRWCL